MNWIIKKIFTLDKGITVLAFLIAVFFVLSVATFIFTGNYRAKNTSLTTQIARMKVISKDVVILKDTVESKEKKIRSSNSRGAVSSLEQILKSLGLKATAIKPLDKKKSNDFTDEKAELEIQNTDLNSIVNLLYKIENSPVPMKINSAALNTTFEDPEKFILKLTVSLLSK